MFLQQDRLTVCFLPDSSLCAKLCKLLADGDSPLKQEEVQVVVALRQEVSKNSCRVTRSNLIGWQTEVKTFDKIPELSHQVLIETPGDTQTDRHINVEVKPQLCYINELAGKGELPLSDCRQDKEHPEVNPKNQNHLKDQLPQNCLPQVQSPVYHHGTWRQRSGHWGR